ncbi:MAG: phosphopantothenoylcysteine decarboxylase [Bacteroidetes bacterium]|nr:phosphopantothenoylcysteine decarboxylase [Bacteroidota bacterium]
MHVLVTAGPTHEPIDPVRFIGNHSSGKMGIAIAEKFSAEGHEVNLVLGATHLRPADSRIQVAAVQTAAEMFEACKQYFPKADVIVFAAAVADYTPKELSPVKIKKKDNELTIELVKTKDIAAELGRLKSDKQLIVGFALETDNEETNALDKLKKKNFDFVVLNSMRDAGAGFQHDTNRITILDKYNNETKFELKSKHEVANDIYDYTMKLIQKEKDITA